MKEKLSRIVLVLLLGIFSFYYTEKSIDFIREKDPIMETIKKESKEFEVKAINATIIDNKIIPTTTPRNKIISGSINDFIRSITFLCNS